MKKSLLLSLGIATAATAVAVVPNVVSPTKSNSFKTVVAKAPVQVQGHGLKRLHTATGNTTINPQRLQRSASKAAALSEGLVLSEDFEGWPYLTTGAEADLMWLPEGWSRESATATEDIDKWSCSMAGMLMPTPTSGDAMMCVGYSKDEKDEWLLTPEVEVGEDFILKYNAVVQLFFMVDYTKLPEKVVATDLEVWFIPSDGSEKVKLYSYCDQIPDQITFDELYDMSSSDFEKNVISLADVAGKKGKIGFHYVGADGDSVFLDDVAVGLPEYEAELMLPTSTLYWGFDNTADFGALNLPIATYPVHADLTWMCYSYESGQKISWTFHDPATNDWGSKDDDEELTLNYSPDYTSDFTKRNNLYYPPTMTGIAPGFSAGSVTAPYTYLQAGGKAEFELTDDNGDPYIWSTGLLAFDHNSVSYGIYTVDAEFGERSTPIFGYNKNVDKYWEDYTKAGDDEADVQSHLFAVANVYVPTEANLVVTGANVIAAGIVKDAAELTLTVYATEDGSIDNMPVIAQTTCKATDFLYPGGKDEGQLQYFNIPFTFDAPVVVNNDKYAMYLFTLSGFDDAENVEYFAPVQSLEAVPGITSSYMGWVFKNMTFNGDTDVSVNAAGSFMDNYAPAAFAINLQAYYPWLDCDTESVEMAADGSVPAVALGSYYDGADLTVEAPAGVSAKVVGRYDEASLVIEGLEGQQAQSGDVVVKAPGVEKTIALSTPAGIIDATVVRESAVTGTFDLTGKAVDAAAAAPGIYVQRHADGSATKVVVK